MIDVWGCIPGADAETEIAQIKTNYPIEIS
jgi:hypothetical protein